jgi:hypothetical protein
MPEPAASEDQVQISFRVPYELKMQFEQAVLYRSLRERRKVTATAALIEQVQAFIDYEEKQRTS